VSEPAARPSRTYEAGVDAGQWQDDPAQRAVLPALDRIHDAMRATPRDGLWSRLRARFSPPPLERGLYLHGGVGRGKTFLMDLLHESLPEGVATRLHFHRFMNRVHAELARIRDEQDPLARVAQRFAERRLLCLDEFFVQDIGDAMILAELLRHLQDRGVVLVTTSNVPPPELYRDGLQRAKFLPAIARIERTLEVHHLASPHDYRLRALTATPTWHAPADAAAEAARATLVERVAPGRAQAGGAMKVHDREIPLKRRADGIAWFEFAALCEGPRAVADYIEIAKSYNTVLVSNVPAFGPLNEDAARRFVHLVDEFYDRNVNLALSAAVPIESLYAGQRLRLEFERTRSRLVEMQSAEYLGREHRP
jgi:cell division protein ZapE